MYENLIKEAEKEKVRVVEISMEKTLKGLYCDNCIAINKNIPTNIEKTCVLAEELGHYYTSAGDILDQTKIHNRKQEVIARRWGYKRLVGIIELVNAYKEGIKNRFELADYLGVTEEFIDECLNYYKEKHGLYYEIDNYIVYFEPLGVLEKIF